MNTQQNKQLHALLAQTGLKAHKESLVLGYTAGRSASSRDLKDSEAEGLINWLRTQPGAQSKTVAKGGPVADKMRKKMIHYAHQMSWYVPCTMPRQVDMVRLDQWCIKYGQYHQPLMDHDEGQLTQLLTQFEAVYKSFLRGI